MNKSKSEHYQKIENDIKNLKADIEHWEKNNLVNDIKRNELISLEKMKSAYIRKCKKLGVNL